MATAVKALTDYVYVNKKDWACVKPAMESLRIESNELGSVSSDDVGLY